MALAGHEPMNIDDERFNSPATRGELGAVSLRMSLALKRVQRGLRAASKNDRKELDLAIAELGALATDLHTQFVELTGYSNDE